MSFRTSSIAALLGAAFALAGCQADIGDPCTSSIDCSPQGDRLCDTSQPEGYCTVFNCEPDGCPEDSVCVGFAFDIDPACKSDEFDPRWPRFERTFCMKACEVQDDCRDGYSCQMPAERDALSVDHEVENPVANSGVCFVSTENAERPAGDPPASCQTRPED